MKNFISKKFKMKTISKLDANELVSDNPPISQKKIVRPIFKEKLTMLFTINFDPVLSVFVKTLKSLNY
jgi:hypothetical protein